MAPRGGVSAVVIGSEVLTAKIVDQNGALLMKRLRERGVKLHSMTFVHDDVDAIVGAVSRARLEAEFVITSGGIGPTHDDVTVRAVALALGRRVVRVPEVEALIREHYRDAVTPEAFRLADAPEGTEMLRQEGSWYPVMWCDRVFILPGVPQLFRLQLETVVQRIPGKPLSVRGMYLDAPESVIAALLDRVAAQLPDVAIGSYPQFGRDAGYRVRVTFEGELEAQVQLAFDRVKAGLAAGAFLRGDDSSS